MKLLGSAKRLDQFLVTLAIACVLVAGSVVVASRGATDPRVFPLAGAVLVLPFLLYAAALRPAPALGFTFILLLIAGTKFRQRSATATLAGEVDTQVRFEIAVFAAIGVILVLALLRRPGVLSSLRRIELVLLAYVALAFVSVLWSPATQLTLVRAVQLSVLFGVAVASSRTMSTARLLRAVAGALVLYILVCALLSIAFPWAGGGYVDYRGTRRFSWFSVHPIFAASMVALCVVLLLSLGLFGPRRWHERLLGLPIWIYLGPLGGLVLASNSRGPTAALLAGAGALLVRKHLRVWTVLLLAAGITAIVFFFASTGETVADLLTHLARTDPRVAELLLRGQSVRDLETFSGRTQLWQEAWPLLLDRPLLGLGFQGSRAALLDATPWAAYAHNALLQTLLDLGLLGAGLLWGAVMYGLLVTARPVAEISAELEADQAAAFAVIVFLIVNSVTSESFAAAPGIEWLALLVAIIVGERGRELARRPARHSVALRAA